MNKKKLNRETKKKSTLFEMYFLIFSTIIILPSIYSSKVLDPTLPTRLLALGIIVLVLFLINILRRNRVKKNLFSFTNKSIFIVYLAFVIWTFVSLLPAINPSEGLFDIAKTTLTLLLLIYIVKVLLTYENTIIVLTKSVILSSIISTTIGFYQYTLNIPGKSGYELFMALYEIKGLMAQKNQFSISLFLMLPFTAYGIFILKKYWKALSIYGTLAIFITITIIQTRSVWIATAAFLIFSIIMIGAVLIRKNGITKSKLIKASVISFSTLCSVLSISFVVLKQTGALETMEYRISSMFDMKSHDNQGRLHIWESTYNLSKDNIIMGVGAGNWKINIPPYFPYNTDIKWQNWRRPHNDFLWVLSEKGIIGLMLYSLIFLLVIYYSIVILTNEKDFHKLILTSLITSGIIGYSIIAQLTFPIERINHQVYLMIFMAIIISFHYILKKKKKYLYPNIFLKIHPYLIIIITSTLFYSSIYLNSELNMNKLFIYGNAGKWKEVITHTEKAFSKFTTIDAFSHPIYLYSGEAYIKLNKPKKAKIDLIKALQYSPTNIPTLNDLGIVSSQLNDSAKAIHYLNTAIEIYPKYEVSLFNKAEVYLRFKDYENAYIALLQCNTKTPNVSYDKYMHFIKRKMDN